MSNLDINFNNILPVNGSKFNGFEEFICQLARKEKINNSKNFITFGRMDQGLECYWELNNGNIIGWQAKYFTSSFTSSQLKQIEDSIKTACNHYDNLEEMIIAVPFKLSPKNKTFNRHLTKWKEMISKKGNNFKITFWWEDDIIQKLTEYNLTGLNSFWFNYLKIDDEFFKKYNESSISNMGDKYKPELSFDENEESYFHALARDEVYYEKFKTSINKFIFNFRSCLSDIQTIKAEINTFENICNEIYEIINIIIKKLIKLLNLYSDMNTLDLKCFYKDFKILNDTLVNFQNNDNHNIKNLIKKINKIVESINLFLDSDEIKLLNNPLLIYYGEAGIGKSFLFADMTNKFSNNNILLFLGSHFSKKNNPETIILEELSLTNYNFNELLDALDCKAQIDGKRIILMIDAINEGNGIKYWNEYLNGLITKISQKDYISLVISIRDSYYDNLKINQQPISRKLTGFTNNINKAIKKYFEYYDVKFDSNILIPEFFNPLFLNLYCQTYSNSYKYMKKSLLDILNDYIQNINDKLAYEFEYDSSINLVEKCLFGIIQIKTDNYDLSYETAYNKCLEILSEYTFKIKFLNKIIEEGIFSRNKFKSTETIEFTYQKIEDYLTVKYLCSNLTKKEIIYDFKEEGKLYNIVKQRSNITLIEMLSLYLPEIYNIELYSLSKLQESKLIKYCMITTMGYRIKELDPEFIAFIENSVSENEYFKNIFLENLIKLAPIENHKLNVNYTHNYLFKMSLADRDSFWTTYLQEIDNEKINSICILIDFCDLECYDFYSEEYIKNAAIMLSWSLSTTNIHLRDLVTKKLVKLLMNKINILIDILEKFEKVNDPYISERLYCIAYGCALQSNNKENLIYLAEHTFNKIFNQKEVPKNILLRDFARSLIEYVDRYVAKTNFDFKLIRPPYKSNFPEIPSDDEIEKYKSNHRAIQIIFHSMMVERDPEGKVLPYGDFGRYIFDYYIDPWSAFYSKEGISNHDLMKVCIKKIFDYGYDVEKHGEFDLKYIQFRSSNIKGRIGKKYQWIALYELLAEISDKYPSIYQLGEGKCNFEGSWQLNLRNIDPTLVNEELYKNKNLSIFKNFYEFNENNWFKLDDLNFNVIDSELRILNEKDNFIILEGSFDWKDSDDIDFVKKEVWSQIRSYLVPTEKFDKIFSYIKYKNFNGRWMPESPDIRDMFNKEICQSLAFDEYYNKYGDEKTYIENTSFEVELPIIQFSSTEEENHYSSEYYRISKKIFDNQKLKYGLGDSCIYTQDGKLVGIDLYELTHEKNMFVINKRFLLKYLKQKNLSIFFTVLGEQMENKNNIFNNLFLSFSGVYYIKNNHVVGNLNPFCEISFFRLKTSIIGLNFEEISKNDNELILFEQNDKILYHFRKGKLINSNKKIKTEEYNNLSWDIYFITDEMCKVDYEQKGGFVLETVNEGDIYSIMITDTYYHSNCRKKLYTKFIKTLMINMSFYTKTNDISLYNLNSKLKITDKYFENL